MALQPWRKGIVIKIENETPDTRRFYILIPEISIFEFTIDDEFIYQRLTEQEGKCAISGIVLTFNVDDWHSMSIDRIDSSLGYTPDNILLVIRFLNIAKGNKSNDALVEEIKLCYEGIMTHS